MAFSWMARSVLMSCAEGIVHVQIRAIDRYSREVATMLCPHIVAHPKKSLDSKVTPGMQLLPK